MTIVCTNCLTTSTSVAYEQCRVCQRRTCHGCFVESVIVDDPLDCVFCKACNTPALSEYDIVSRFRTIDEYVAFNDARKKRIDYTTSCVDRMAAIEDASGRSVNVKVPNDVLDRLRRMLRSKNRRFRFNSLAHQAERLLKLNITTRRMDAIDAAVEFNRTSLAQRSDDDEKMIVVTSVTSSGSYVIERSRREPPTHAVHFLMQRAALKSQKSLQPNLNSP